jgi:hypothetical protein
VLSALPSQQPLRLIARNIFDTMDALNGIGHSFFVTVGYEMNLSFGLRSKSTSNVQMAALTSKHNALAY